MAVAWFSFARNKERADQAISIDYADGGTPFLEGNLAGLLVTRDRLLTHWAPYCASVVSDDMTVARALAVGFSRARRGGLNPAGWDEAVTWAVADLLDGVRPDTACALEIAVAPAHQGKGFATVALQAMRDVVAAAGIDTLIAPLRPPGKTVEPTTLMSQYAARRRNAGYLPMRGCEYMSALAEPLRVWGQRQWWSSAHLSNGSSGQALVWRAVDRYVCLAALRPLLSMRLPGSDTTPSQQSGITITSTRTYLRKWRLPHGPAPHRDLRI